MENIRGKILWIDDEIQHLKPHIMYLESKGYNIDSTNNGNHGVILAKKINMILYYWIKICLEWMDYRH